MTRARAARSPPHLRAIPSTIGCAGDHRRARHQHRPHPRPGGVNRVERRAALRAGFRKRTRGIAFLPPRQSP
jgi:hypothetical protein